MKTKEGTVTAIKLTLRNYKHSGSSSPVDIFRLPRETSLPGLFPVRVYKYSGAISGTSYLLARCLDLQYLDPSS